ncbi:FAD-binding oxidoreductase [Ancylobacter dichloromethanicus]|uniref:D-amino-acid dehydrogenase n=1 Tax=Ancylobacter dichloromethanicus TaxID=518825 RepID=A0A9W6MYG2_9HYPH|nr:FAD-binding oxidoreductase [Ancylobacter dichloromethanicus]MBS7554504.1 FAD-binding oxidoreductase [Ancylobacter dichloromethanicus]GLK71634.1 D-amino-acid dehydrogenase [Ancylobacter dichloromethanicus]
MKTDTIVLGAGIVGTSVALHLAQRGRSVVLVDRRGPGEETSYGNAGLVERASLYPVAFPRKLSALAEVALGRNPAASYHWGALLRLVPWMFAYWRASAPDRILDYARTMETLLVLSVQEHDRLARAAGATHFFREGGWLKLYRTEAGLDNERSEFPLARRYGLSVREIGIDEALAMEPFLRPVFRGAVIWSDPHSVSSPGGVTQAYAAHFAELGGQVRRGDARSLARLGSGWAVTTEEGSVEAPEVVVALGPWAMDVLRPFGLALPLAVKRGYHMHYHAEGGASLSRPVLDEEGGYVITPTVAGIRLTTGVEFARRDAPKSPVQLEKTEVLARGLFPLGGRAEAEPWMGCRPAFPDMLPVLGPAPGQNGMWLAIGHQHLGFTLGPVSGRLLAEMMTGQTPCADPAPFAAERFG